MTTDGRGIVAANGRVVTEADLDRWSDALGRDEWPEGWESRGEVVHGRPPMSAGGSVTLSVKVPKAMKRRIDREARDHGTTTSVYVRELLASAMGDE